MTESNVLARPYAKAAFEYALTCQTLSVWQQALGGLAECMASDKVQCALQLPQNTSKKAGEIVLALMADLLSEPCQNFVRLLAQNKRLTVLPEITVLFDDLYRAHQQTLHVDVTVAITLTDEQKTTLAAALTKRFARTVEVSYHIDKTILGGAVVRAGDIVIDGSFAGQLKQLTDTLIA